MNNQQLYDFRSLPKEFFRWAAYFYKDNWPDDFKRDEKDGFQLQDFSKHKSDFDWLGCPESYAEFKTCVVSHGLFFEEKKGDMDARIIGIGTPSNGLRIIRPVSRIVYFFDQLRNKRIMGDRILLQKLIHFNFIDEQKQPVLEASVEQAIQRIRKQGRYSKDVDLLDDLVDQIVKANEKSKGQ